MPLAKVSPAASVAPALWPGDSGEPCPPASAFIVLRPEEAAPSPGGIVVGWSEVAPSLLAGDQTAIWWPHSALRGSPVLPLACLLLGRGRVRELGRAP